MADVTPFTKDRTLSTDDLVGRRVAQSPTNPVVESQALCEIAKVASQDLPTIFKRLSELVVELCSAGSAGVSLIDCDAVGAPIFRWAGVAGAWAPYVGGAMPRHASPCGVVVERNATLLIENLPRIFPAAADLEPPVVEALLTPFHTDGRPVGTVWAVAHDPTRKFGSDDATVLVQMARFAAAAQHGRIADTLVEAISQAGDRRAFTLLFDTFTPRLTSFFWRTGCRTYEAEDLIQETLLAVWGKASQFDSRRGSADAWIFTIAKHLRIDAVRRSATFTRSRNLLNEDAFLLEPDRPLSSSQVQRAFATLSSDQAAVVRAAYFDDKPHAEISRALNIPLGTVKSRLRLAIRRLKAELQQGVQ
jgi:RNA polymerase sigma-70 factor (ECF subfamily)